ncbi:hypothetical protein [Streptococcus suis]|uniref:hypothetical protein n=1 Tax=Streptococcus suis TaxID=1307 RepID=UPI000AED6FD4
MSYLFGISTHAPVWGATSLVVLYTPPKSISTHAPVWGATDREADFINCVI